MSGSSLSAPWLRKVARTGKHSNPARHSQRHLPAPTYRLLPPPVLTATLASIEPTPAALIDSEPSLCLLVSHGHQLGLHFWQDVSDPQRIMFDATQFNRIGGYTLSKGIKGDFLTRMKRILEETASPLPSR